MPATIYEVAERSGVSIGTVSRVLNGSPLTAVATRARVLQVMHELNYHPHALAQGLARRKTNAIGVVVPLLNDRLRAEMLRGIQRGLARYNVDLLLYGVDDLRKKDTFLQRAVQRRRVDGLLVVSMKLSNAWAADCKRRRLPLILVDSRHQQFDSFNLKAPEGTPLTAQHWARLGYQAVKRMTALLEKPASAPRHLCLKPRPARRQAAERR